MGSVSDLADMASEYGVEGLNPLKIGECFRHVEIVYGGEKHCLNPLKIGECFRRKAMVGGAPFLVLIP